MVLNESIEASKSGFQVMEESFKGSLGAFIFLIICFIIAYFLIKYKLDR